MPERQVIEISMIGNIIVREDGKVHMYFSQDNEEITHEIVLKPEATKQFEAMISSRFVRTSFGFNK